MRKKLTTFALLAAMLISMIPTIPARAIDMGNGYSTNPPSGSWVKVGETPAIELPPDTTANQIPQYIEKYVSADYQTCSYEIDTYTCYHYFESVKGTEKNYGGNVYFKDGKVLVKAGEDFTIPANLSADGKSHTFTAPASEDGKSYEIWGFKYKAAAKVRGIVSESSCQEIQPYFNKYYAGGILIEQPYVTIETDKKTGKDKEVQHDGGTVVTYGSNPSEVDFKDAVNGGTSVHGYKLCDDASTPYCNKLEVSVAAPGYLLYSGKQHTVTAYKFYCWNPAGYTIHYSINKPSWAMFLTESGTMQSEIHQKNETFNLPKNTYALTASGNGPSMGGYGSGVVTSAEFVGWNTAQDGSGTFYADGQRVSNVTADGSIVTLYAQWKTEWPNTPTPLITSMDTRIYAIWKPINYYVKYDSNNGTGQEVTHPTKCVYDQSYTPYTQKDTGFEKTGYYIKYWYYPLLQTRYTTGDKDWPVGKKSIQAQFKNLSWTEGETVRLIAKWEPITYTIRVHENYAGTSDRTKDYTVKYDQDFKLPYPSPWKNNGVVVGYDTNPAVKISPKWANQDSVKNLTDQREDIVDIYTIWDLPPKVTTSVSEIHLSRLKCAASALGTKNGTISQSELEAELMTYATATDYEWQDRYGGTIKYGSNKGYTFGISSFEPGTIVDKASKEEAQVYYITFTCTDDAGQSAQAYVTLFIGDIDIDILVR